MVKKITVVQKVDHHWSRFSNGIWYVESGNKYVVYTLNETSGEGLVKLYVAGFQNKDGQNVAKSIESDEEWNKIKEIMKEIITGGN
jgi:uncharacterized protein YrzB (UPF0473 family)